MDNDAWAAEVTEMEAAFEALARRGLVVACGQLDLASTADVCTWFTSWPRASRRKNFFALAFDAYDYPRCLRSARYAADAAAGERVKAVATKQTRVAAATRAFRPIFGGNT